MAYPLFARRSAGFRKNDCAAGRHRIIQSVEETTRFRMKERENKTIVTSGHHQPLPAGWPCDPTLRFLGVFLRGRPIKHPARKRGSGSARTWRPVAAFSIKNRFRIPNALFLMRAFDESTTRRFNKGHQPTSTRDQLDAKTQDPVSSRRHGNQRHHPVRPLPKMESGGGP
jgi:hypothetical protein